MQYIGGKQKSGGAQIAKVINRVIRERGLTTYAEPFCGGLSVLQRIVAPMRHASDACEALVCLYQALQAGWVPPVELSREKWQQLRDANDPTNPLTAFAGFGCSNRGAWFSAYQPKSKRTGDNYVDAALAASESLANKMQRSANVRFACHLFADAPLGDVVYCDPPYADTMGYPAVPGEWDSIPFWAWVRHVSDARLVCVSEQKAPEDFTPLLTFSIQSRIAVMTGARRDEFLFVPQHQLDVWSQYVG